MASSRLDTGARSDIPDNLAEAIQEFLRAGRRYREFLKRNYPDRLAGVVYAENEDGDMVLYSEGEVFTRLLRAVEIPNG